MARQLISSGSTFEHDMAYSRAVVDGEWVFVSGTTGFDYASMTISDDVAEQTEQCLRNIAWALGQANASLAESGVLPDLKGTPRRQATASAPKAEEKVAAREVVKEAGVMPKLAKPAKALRAPRSSGSRRPSTVAAATTCR